jgi:hypothetical protein
VHSGADGATPEGRREFIGLPTARVKPRNSHQSANVPCQAAEESAAEGQAPQQIWMAETRADAEAAFDAFVEKGAECLNKYRESC